jgi:N-methylhydantoinase A
LGGEQPTVTDANLVLGRLSDELLGGRLRLDVEAAHSSIQTRVAEPLGVSVVQAARSVLAVVNAAMAKGMHLMSVARGRDPRSLGIVAFGGAGPLHACELAESVGSDEVIVPLLPGNTSALGLVLAKVRRERSEMVLTPLESVDERVTQDVLDRLTANVTNGLRAEGVAPNRILLYGVARLCYEGQRYQLDIPLSTRALGSTPRLDGAARSLASSFHDRHLRAYGYVRDEPLHLFSLVIVGVGDIGPKTVAMTEARARNDERSGRSSRKVWFGDSFYEAEVLPRQEISLGESVMGPAIVEQVDTTIVIPPSWGGRADSGGNLLLKRVR